MNEFFVQGNINGFADLRGRALVVDAPDTAYALQLKKILAQHGLKEGDYKINPVGAGPFRFKALMEDKSNAGGILNLPFTVQAEGAGMKSLGRTIDMLGAYQAAGAFAMRAWAEKNRETLERYLAAYIECIRWVRAPANKAQASRSWSTSSSSPPAKRNAPMSCCLTPPSASRPTRLRPRGFQERACVARRA